MTIILVKSDTCRCVCCGDIHTTVLRDILLVSFEKKHSKQKECFFFAAAFTKQYEKYKSNLQNKKWNNNKSTHETCAYCQEKNR